MIEESAAAAAERRGLTGEVLEGAVAGCSAVARGEWG